MLNRYALLIACSWALTVSAQVTPAGPSKVKMDLVLQHHLNQPHAEGEFIDLFIHGSAGAVESAVLAQGGLVKMSMARLVSARLPIGKVRTLAADPAVERFEWSADEGQFLCDSMRVKARVNQVHAGLAPLPQAYDGTGVIMGFIDDGLGIDHPDFKLPNNTTRVLHYWDQGLSGSGAPPEFGYGLEWNKAQIDAGQLTSDFNGSVHGSTVAGAGAGDGSANGRHKGVAPGADLIVVRYSGAVGVDFRTRVADGVKYIFDRAEAAGMPVVVNASLGTYGGSHDGKDAAALFIDSLIAAKRGRFLVCAGGNSGAQFPYHVRTNVDSDTSFTWFTTNANVAPYNIFPFPNLFFEAWADLSEIQNVQFAVGADRVTPSLQFRGRTAFHNLAQNLGTTITEPLMNANGDTLGMVELLAMPRGDQVQMQVLMANPDSASYLWRFMSTGSGRYDLWTLTTVTATSNVIGPTVAAPLGLPFPTAAEYPAMAHYVEPDRNSHIVDSWACSPRTLTTANYWNQTEYQPCAGAYIDAPVDPYTISGNSSMGPTRDDRYKPDISAPGDVTLAAAPLALIDNWSTTNADKMDTQCMHVRNGGTSMASPVVAGVAALYLQKCPNADWQQIRNAIISTAWGDALTGALPNNSFGYGRVHAFDALVTSNLAPVTITAADDEMCPDDSVQVTAPAGYTAYLWSNGATTNPAWYSGSGPLTVTATTAPGCASSNALSFTVLPAPPTPVITPNGTFLTSSAGPSYQWYLNGTAINGAIGQSHWATAVGNYTVEHTAANGCSAMSAPVNVTVLAVDEGTGSSGFAAWPSPTRGELTVQLPASASGPVTIEIFDAAGRLRHQDQRVASQQIMVPLESLAPGTYTLLVRTEGVSWATRVVRVP